LECCKRHNIAVEAFSPLARGRRLNDPILMEVASRNACTPAQVMLRWCIQRGAAVIPKTVSPARMKENLEALNICLSPEDMIALDALDGNARTTTWNPYDFP